MKSRIIHRILAVVFGLLLATAPVLWADFDLSPTQERRLRSVEIEIDKQELPNDVKDLLKAEALGRLRQYPDTAGFTAKFFVGNELRDLRRKHAGIFTTGTFDHYAAPASAVSDEIDRYFLDLQNGKSPEVAAKVLAYYAIRASKMYDDGDLSAARTYIERVSQAAPNISNLATQHLDEYVAAQPNHRRTFEKNAKRIANEFEGAMPNTPKNVPAVPNSEQDDFSKVSIIVKLLIGALLIGAVGYGLRSDAQVTPEPKKFDHSTTGAVYRGSYRSCASPTYHSAESYQSADLYVRR
jgi:hypothetical protein